MTKITDGTFRIVPNDIGMSHRMWDAFGHLETDTSAGWIVMLCQERGTWAPFTQAELDAFYHRVRPNESFNFNRLINAGLAHYARGSVMMGGGWIVREGDVLYVTEDFVLRCFKASPATKAAP